MRTARASYRPLSRALANVTVLVVVLSAISASAQPKSNPYQGIAFRNAFGLKPPVPKSTTPEPPPRAMPNLALNGIVDFYRVRCALVTRTDPGRPPQNYTLDLGEFEGGLKLINLDAKSATATVQVDGTDTLTLKLGSNSVSKPSPSPQVPGVGRPFQMPVINR